jgi:hypothetical protein
MGMGYGANYADVIEDKDVQKLCPKEYKAFDNAIDDNEGYDLEAIAREITFEGMESIAPKIKKAYIALTKAFNKKTGLELGIGFHDADESGDRYDEVNGAYWNVGGVFTRTPAGKKYKALIDRKFYVTFG